MSRIKKFKNHYKKTLVIKTKAHIYKYTGIFLAYKEQCNFLESEQFWSEFSSRHNKKSYKSMRPRDIQGLTIGLWQANHGFIRPHSSIGMGNRSSWLWKLINSIASGLLALKWDIQSIFRKKSKISINYKKVKKKYLKKK